jgi:hypothetical protein
MKAAAFALTSVLAAGAAQATPDPDPVDVAQFPAGYVLPCSAAPRTAVLSVPAPFDRHMRIICSISGHMLAPMHGSHWVFTNGQSMTLSALSTHSQVTGQAAHFTSLRNAPLSAAESAGLISRLKPVVNDPAMLDADVMRMEVDTSTGDHKQILLFVARAPGGRAWGMECFNECDPMESPPWAFIVTPDTP